MKTPLRIPQSEISKILNKKEINDSLKVGTRIYFLFNPYTVALFDVIKVGPHGFRTKFIKTHLGHPPTKDQIEILEFTEWKWRGYGARCFYAKNKLG